jgi:hypothetical protein
MAKQYRMEITGQPTRYGKKWRKFSMYFSEPEQGIGKHTGILLLIAGYGGCAMSHVYQKMRDVFADQYDLLTLQCDYLGYEFMQNNHHLAITRDMLHQVLSPGQVRSLEKDYEKNKFLLSGKVMSGEIFLGETEDNFNEMGIWQAMDHLVALKILFEVVKENHAAICRERVYIYGQSHGGYLAYLCNLLSPGLFSGIIDNSAYLFPYFMFHDRSVTKVGELITLEKRYHYFVSELSVDIQSYDLSWLYRFFTNRAKIIVYHGADDEMIPIEEKKAFLENLPFVSLHIVSEADGVMFRSTGHSLGADFFRMFDDAIQELETGKEYADASHQEYVTSSFFTEQYLYEVREDSGIPILYWQRRKKDG